jgi:hypothetical protein
MATMPQRRAALTEHRAKVERRISALRNALRLIDRKLAYYDRALAETHAGEDA